MASLTFLEGHGLSEGGYGSDAQKEPKDGSTEEADTSSDDENSLGLRVWPVRDQNFGQIEVMQQDSNLDESTDEGEDDSDDGGPLSLGLMMRPVQEQTFGHSKLIVEELNSDEEAEEDSDVEMLYSVELRMWPTRANLIFYDSTGWVFTRAYCLRWLSVEQIEPLVHTIKESGNEIDVDEFSISHQPPMDRSNFEGPMVSSRAVENLVERKLSPSLLDFDIKQRLGKGATCNVFLCTYHLDGKDYAVKMIRLNEDDHISSEPREITIMSHLRSEFIVKFSQAWVECDTSGTIQYEEPNSSSNESGAQGCHEPTNQGCSKYVLIQMEHCPRSLKDYLAFSRKVDAEESYKYFEEITKGLKYIHEEGVIHRDLKPGNVFLGSDGVVKIGDFGQSCFRPTDCIFFRATPNRGTPFYEAPELGDGETISEKVDVHPLGVMYFELYNSFNTMRGKHKEFDNFKESSSEESLSGKGNSLLCLQMIAPDPLERPSAEDILESLTKALG